MNAHIHEIHARKVWGRAGQIHIGEIVDDQPAKPAHPAQ